MHPQKDDYFQYTLSNPMGSAGGAGAVYQLMPRSNPPLVAKVYNDKVLQRIRTDRKYAQRIIALAVHRDELAKSLPFATWPRRLIFSQKNPVDPQQALLGFTMERLVGTVSLLDLITQKNARLKITPNTTAFLCITLADQIARMHRHGGPPASGSPFFGDPMNIFDPNAVFTDLHRQLQKGTISKEEHDRRQRAMLVLNGKLPGPLPVKGVAMEKMSEQSGTLSYDWSKDGDLSIRLLKAWDGHGNLNAFHRHVRQAARVELNDSMTEMEAAKLRVARASGDAVFEAVMDDLLCARAEEILKQSPDAKRAVNIDERFHLADNPDVIPKEELETLIDGAGRKALADMER